jgi:hypothetical protein
MLLLRLNCRHPRDRRHYCDGGLNGDFHRCDHRRNSDHRYFVGCLTSIFQEVSMIVDTEVQLNNLNQPVLAHEWKRWIAENKMMGIDNDWIVNVLLENGIEERLVREELSVIESHPYFQAGEWMAQKTRKLESLLQVYTQLARTSLTSGIVERRRALSRAEFREDYYALNRPVILVDAMRNWKALSLWNAEYLKAKCGDELVEVMADRNSDPSYEVNLALHRRKMLFREYVDIVASGRETNDYYLVANNHFLEQDGPRALLDDIEMFPEYLDPEIWAGRVFFWYGPAGTVTPLHHDVGNIFMAQVHGRKRVKLISSNEIPLVYNHFGVFSEVDSDNPDYRRHPRYRDAQVMEVLLEPGEVLFLPVGWWHQVRALDVSITVSFMNFAFPNDYQWPELDIRR